MPTYRKGDESIQWLQSDGRASTIPISSLPAKEDETIIGAAFFIQYNGMFFLVSAKHVVEKPHVLMFFTKQNAKAYFPSTMLEMHDIKWVHHPDGLDISALSLPPQILTDKAVRVVPEAHWNLNHVINKESEIAHLGYPDMKHANFKDGTPALEAIAMPGKYLGLENTNIIVETNSDEGASGGPAYINMNGSPRTFGMATHTKRVGSEYRPRDAMKLDKTVILPLVNVKPILDSEEMWTQCVRSGWSIKACKT